MKNDKLIHANTDRWAKAQFKSSALKTAYKVAKRLVATKDRYVSLSNKTGVPWFVIAVIHEREASQRWDRSIAQGDPYSKVSTHVPKGRGPFASWEAAGVDALKNCGPYASKWSDWSAGGAMTLLELYNGLGYANKGRPSPYIWSGTNQYISGKYVADGVYDTSVVDPQLGCAVLIKAMAALDDGVSFDIKSEPKADPKLTPSPEVSKDQKDAIEAPKAGPVGDAEDTKPAVESKTIWASVLGTLSTVGGFLTDWKVIAVVAVLAVFAYIVWERQGKPDIRGLFH